MGLMSRSWFVPGVADPGAVIVKLAHERVKVNLPLVGPSSILLAMMASGMNGQRVYVSWLFTWPRKRRKERASKP
jgi:16S rRNA (cytidine1402-2'-O)-methyltransferase